ncbi:hypothetical protein ACHAXT_007143 [Thalassiosira profunda]
MRQAGRRPKRRLGFIVGGSLRKWAEGRLDGERLFSRERLTYYKSVSGTGLATLTVQICRLRIMLSALVAKKEASIRQEVRYAAQESRRPFESEAEVNARAERAIKEMERKGQISPKRDAPSTNEREN